MQFQNAVVKLKNVVMLFTLEFPDAVELFALYLADAVPAFIIRY